MKSAIKRASFHGALTTSALLLAALSNVAVASPVTTWTYTTNSTFSAPTWSAGDGSTDVSNYELSWGASGGNFTTNTNIDDNRSALTIGNAAAPNGGTTMNGGPATGTINTTIGGTPNPALGQIGMGISITHWNNPLSGNYSTLTGALITDTLSLTPSVPNYYTNPVSAPTLTFQFQFRETNNAGAYGAGGFGNAGSGYCADGTAGGNCADLFGFSNTQTLDNAFTYLDYGADNALGGGDDFNRIYYASVFVLDTNNQAFPLSQLTSGECQALGLGTSCYGFRTAEAAHTTAKFAFAVTTEPFSVPEPGSLALLGSALLVLSALRRRKS